MIDCCDNAGGRVIIEINGTRYSARGSVTIRPTNFEREAGANSDNTLYVTTKPMPAEAEMTLSDRCGLSLDVLTASCRANVTIQLIDMNRVYFFTGAAVVGRPEIDTESGEVKGLKIAAPTAVQQ